MARSDGSVFKICRCRDPHTRKPLGNTCPKLRRANRAWSTNHGQWAYQIELPPTAEGQRRQLRPTGFADRAAAEREMDHVRRLLDLAEGDKHRLVELADSIQIARRATGVLPDIETVRQRLRTDSPLSGVPTLAEYLPQWLHDLEVDDSTRRSYGSHVRTQVIY